MKVAHSARQIDFWNPQDITQSFEHGVSEALDIPEERGLWRDQFGVALRAWQEERLRDKPRVLSLFSGAGGLDIGFHDTGFEIIEMVELEEDFVSSLRANIGEGRYFQTGNPRCIDIRDYRASFSKVDFIIGGPPCQTFSAAGRRALGVEGTNEARGMLFQEYARLLGDLRPKGFLFENVYGMTGAENGKSMAMVIEAFEQIGYSLQYRVLDAADYGVPQHRERLILVGLREGEFRFPTPTHGPDSPGSAPFCTAGEALSGCEPDESESLDVNGRHGHLLGEIPPGLNYSFFTEKLGHPRPIFAWRSKFSDYLYKADPDEPVRTIKAQGGQYTGPFHWSGRRFSLSEIKRLQSFPDGYRFHGGRQRVIQQIGNSVPPQLSRLLACAILKQVFGGDLPFELPTLAQDAKLGFRQRKRTRTASYQRIAQQHIQKSPPVATGKARSHVEETITTYGTRTSGYDFNFSDTRQRGDYRLSARLGRSKWTVEILSSEQITSSKWSLRAKANRSEGNALVDSFELIGDFFTLAQLACSWRFLENLMAKRGLKDDLIQLFGYYQYRPRYELSIEFSSSVPDRPMSRLIDELATGNIVRRTMPETELREILGVNLKKMRGLLMEARREGFDIRTRKTNPQIPEGHLLIPYPFPTLNGMSVTGRKPIF